LTIGTLIVVGGYSDFEIVEKLSSINLKAWLICLESDTISDPGTKHHLRALHKVVHAVLQPGHKCFLIDEVEVDFLICCNLYPNVPSDKVDLPSHVIEFMVLYPETCFFMDFEEQY